MVRAKPSIKGVSLVEVLVALILLSFSIMGAGHLLLSSMASHQRAIVLQQRTFFVWSLVQAFKAAPNHLPEMTAWQKKLDEFSPGSILSVHKTDSGFCVMTITASTTAVTEIQLKIRL